MWKCVCLVACVAVLAFEAGRTLVLEQDLLASLTRQKGVTLLATH